MSSSWPSPGVGYAPAYQVSATPFVTSSADGEVSSSEVIEISFPYVTRWVQIRNSGSSTDNAELKVGFSNKGVSGLGAVTGSAIPKPETAELSGTHQNYFKLNSDNSSAIGTTTDRLELKCSSLFFQTTSGTSGFTVVAGLTGIPIQGFVLTGSSGFQGVG
tara:strand:+ start:88 stop:570 length:483 start_codon:yes stop_codon:yes gene_type:complete